MHEGASSALLVDGRDYFVAFVRAALAAKRSILLAGWQFDSDVSLIRGDDLPPGTSERDFELLPFLDRLTRQRPELEVRMLAWDHNVVYTFEREPLQKVVFDVVTCERFAYELDAICPTGGSHHQKLAVIDGRLGFVGSNDLCHSRWDDSSHRLQNDERTTRFGIPHGPYHEVQAALGGEVARSLLDLFADRWEDATGEALDREGLVAPRAKGIDVPVTIRLPPARIALSRTVPAFPERRAAYEVRDLFAKAILRAERLVYIETQYLTSTVVRDALVARMRDRSMPKLDVVIVLPKNLEAFKEEVTVAHPQALVLDAIAQAARRDGHALGLYNVVVPGHGLDGDASEDTADTPIYIHSKVTIIDDCFMMIGSANLTNRSMTLDSELVACWEACDPDRAEDRGVAQAIRSVRTRLLLEHVGDTAHLRDVVMKTGLVARLDRIASERRGRLRRYDVRHLVASMLTRAVHGLAGYVLEPEDVPPSRRTSAA